VAFGYFLVVWNVNGLSGNRYLNILYGGMMEVGSMALYYFMARYAGRCRTYIFLMGSSAFSVAATAFLHLSKYCSLPEFSRFVNCSCQNAKLV